MSDLPPPVPPKGFCPTPFSYHQELVITIDSLANSGDGVGRVEGWVVFVPFALPRERVRVRVWRNDKSYSIADLIQVLDPSPSRIEPVCRLFGKCGGCQYQHVSYAEQLEWKTQQVADLLRLQAGIAVPVQPAIASPVQFGYRSKITPHFNKPRVGSGKPVVEAIGFLRAGSRHDVIDVPQCPIAMDCINAALPRERDRIRAGAGQYKRGSTILLRASDRGSVVITNHREVATEWVGDMQFNFLAGDFFQNNPFILPAFTDYVADQATRHGEHFLVDAYCGSGLFAVSLAKHFTAVYGVEVSESAADWARANARTNGIEHATFFAADASQIFAQITTPPQETTVLIDPPRKGSDAAFLQQLFAFAPQTVVYVSCNPATQIRDLAEFARAGYAVVAVQPFDLFPQTKHLECVVTLRKGDPPDA